MAQKYELIYLDVVNVEHELQIYDDTYSDAVIEIQGKIFLDSSSADGNLEAIRGKGLRVELEADADLTFEDLWSEDEKTYPVTYLRDSVTLFDGWLNPEGFHENFVSPNWVVSFDCVDGLGYLENLSFVNTDGTPITGRKTQLEVIRLALLRTGLQKDINTNIDIYYTGLSTSVNVLDNVYVITDRYKKEDGDTFMSCIEVLRDILEPYGAVITSYNDAWWIYKPNQLYKLGDTDSETIELTFYNYDYLGASGTDVDLEFAVLLGSHIDNYYPHHCNENQSLGLAPSTGAYRISYKYGFAQFLISNVYLYSGDGSTLDDWDILSSSNMTLENPGYGVTFTNVAIGATVQNIRCEEIELSAGVKVDIEWDAHTVSTTVIHNLNYQVIVGDDLITAPGVNLYYLQDDNSWGAVGVAHTKNKKLYPDGSALNETSFTTDAIPSAIGAGTAYFYIVFYTPYATGGAEEGTTELNFVNLSINEESEIESSLEGEVWTFQRTTKPSAQIRDTKEVATGDNETDLYIGTLYKTDSSTPTSTWFRKDITEAVPILQLMGEELMRMEQLPARIYIGDIYGYVNYLSVITISGIDGLFMILEYSYNTYSNVTSLKLKRIFGDELGDIESIQTFDYGEVVTPTIRG